MADLDMYVWIVDAGRLNRARFQPGAGEEQGSRFEL
jgi:hypothetical protein